MEHNKQPVSTYLGINTRLEKLNIIIFLAGNIMAIPLFITRVENLGLKPVKKNLNTSEHSYAS